MRVSFEPINHGEKEEEEEKEQKQMSESKYSRMMFRWDLFNLLH